MNLKSSVISFAVIIAAFFAPIVPLVILVGISIFVDTLFGIIKAKKRKQKITSRRLSALISKMFLYEFAVIGMFIVDKYLIGDIIAVFTSIPLVLTKLVVATLLSIELKSINENIESSFKINLWDEFKKMLKRAKDVKDDINGLVDSDDDNEEGNIDR